MAKKDQLQTSINSNRNKLFGFIRKRVKTNEDAEDVAKVMAKYDLEAIPVVDENQTLLGRITIDDIVDVIKEEADKDYQLAAGITQDVEADDSIIELTRARLPWLFLGLVGGIGAFIIMYFFEGG